MAKEARTHPPFQGDSDFERDRPSLEEPNIHSVQQQALLSPVPKSHREQKRITPHEYKQAIYAHSQRSLVSSSFPGHNYAALANWLIRPNTDFHLHKKDTGRAREDKHSLIVVHNLDDDGPERTQILTEEDLPVFVGSTTSHQGKGQLLFVQGFPSPTLVANLGSRYRIDPEFFCRHLDFFDISAHGQYFNMPSLLNTTNNIIHVSVSTILTNATAYSTTNSYEDFTSNRQLMRNQLFRYKRSLQNSASCGDSIFREYSILSDRYSIIEQRVSICLTESGDSWTALLCMDSGRDLDQSLIGPWNYTSSQKHNIKTTALPVIQHHPKMAWRKLGDIDPSSRLFRGQTYLTRPGLPQSISTIPHGYPSLLSALNLMRRAESDPLHALIPIFAHAAFSEVAFLNLVDELMEKLTEPLPLDNFQSENFESLQHFEVILERHAAQIRQSTRSIQILNENSLFPSLKNVSASPGGRNSRSPSSYQGPVGNKSAQSSYIQNQQTSFSATGILQDYDDLLERCLGLLSRVNSAKNSEMNRAMILESRRAIEQSERMKKLTLLATYFIPLSFTASLFGMNFNIFGQGDLAVWWYIVFAVPFMLLTHMLSSYDPRDSFSGYRRLRRFFR